MMTHRAIEKNMQDALRVIDKMDCVCEKTVLIRVES
jgi:hypothetical protein